jgi:ABC-type amino acid transport substrate-binding protein
VLNQGSAKIRGMSSRTRLVAAALSCLTPSFAAAPRVAAGDLAQIMARGSVRVLAGADEDPVWFSIRKSESPGFEREVLEGFARLHKLRFEAVPVARWEEAIPMLLRQEGDILAGVSITPERQKRVDFSVELLPARSIVVTRRPGAPVRTLAELRAARVAIVPNTTWAEALEKAGVPVARALRVEDISGAVEAIQTGHADATVTGVVDFLLQRRKNRDLEAGLALGEALSSAWAVRKGSPELRQALDAYLVELRRSPNWSRLLVKYFGDDAPAILGRQPVS